MKPPAAATPWWVRIIRLLIAAVFPARCLVCGSFLPGRQEADAAGCGSTPCGVVPADYERLMGSFLCRVCLPGFTALESPLCVCCGMMFKTREGQDHLCGDCLEAPKRFTTARGCAAYHRGFRAAIHSFKYKGHVQLARPLGALLFATFRRYWSPFEIDRVVPVPLHDRKMRQRGFNPSYLLVRDWESRAAAMDEGWAGLRVERDLLLRARPTLPQTGLNRRQRWENVRNAFALKAGACLDGKKILLVDDVYTTGATLDECTRVLLSGGAARVDVLTLARTL